jgi:hypothetical protein
MLRITTNTPLFRENSFHILISYHAASYYIKRVYYYAESPALTNLPKHETALHDRFDEISA